MVSTIVFHVSSIEATRITAGTTADGFVAHQRELVVSTRDGIVRIALCSTDVRALQIFDHDKQPAAPKVSGE